MSKRHLQIAASLLLLLALALLVIGLSAARPLLWGAGLVAVAVAILLSLATQWAGRAPD